MAAPMMKGLPTNLGHQTLTTVFSEPDRGRGGSASYRGNWGPGFVRAVLEYLQPRRVLDPAVGGGTTLEVCQAMGIEAEGYDLNPHPRLGQGGFDARRDDPGYAPDCLTYHPPYWGGYIRYSGHVWGDQPDPRDLSHIEDWGQFMRALNETVMHLWATLRVGGHMLVLVGDIAKQGRLYSMAHEIVWPGTPIRAFVKLQHNASSYRTPYNGRFVPITHENALLFRKTEPYRVRVVYTVERDLDMRERPLTWLQVVQAAVEALGGSAPVGAVYEEIARQFPARVARSPHWRAYVRKHLQLGPRFRRLERGLYAIA